MDEEESRNESPPVPTPLRLANTQLISLLMYSVSTLYLCLVYHTISVFTSISYVPGIFVLMLCDLLRLALNLRTQVAPPALKSLQCIMTLNRVLTIVLELLLGISLLVPRSNVLCVINDMVLVFALAFAITEVTIPILSKPFYPMFTFLLMHQNIMRIVTYLLLLQLFTGFEIIYWFACIWTLYLALLVGSPLMHRSQGKVKEEDLNRKRMVIFLSILFDLVVILNATVFKIRDQLSSTGTVMALLALQMVNLVTVLVLGKNRELLSPLLIAEYHSQPEKEPVSTQRSKGQLEIIPISETRYAFQRVNPKLRIPEEAAINQLPSDLSTPNREQTQIATGRGQEQDTMISCQICFEARNDSVMYPCGHCLCNHCGLKLLKKEYLCPFCRMVKNQHYLQKIERLLKLDEHLVGQK